MACEAFRIAEAEVAQVAQNRVAAAERPLTWLQVAQAKAVVRALPTRVLTRDSAGQREQELASSGES